MYTGCGYASSLLRSWRIPAFVLLAIITHWFVEMSIRTGLFRPTLILISLPLSPLIVSAVARRKKILWGAAINGAYLMLSYTAFILEHGWAAAKDDFMIFIVVLAFGLVCGACAGAFYERLSRNFNRAI